MTSRIFLVVDRTLVVIACVAIVAIMVLTAVSVVGRYFFAAPVPDDLIINEMLLVFVVFLPMGYVQRLRGHVNVTLFSAWMSPRARARLDTFGIVVGVVAIGLFAHATFDDFYLAWSENQYHEGLLEIPEWPGRLVVCLGLTVLWLRLVLDLVSAILPGRTRERERQ